MELAELRFEEEKEKLELIQEIDENVDVDDTRTIIEKYIDGTEMESKKSLNSLMQELWLEATNRE